MSASGFPLVLTARLACWAICLLLGLAPQCRAAEVCTGDVCPVPSATSAASAFDGQRAYRDLVRQCEFGPRVPGTKAHAECKMWLIAQLADCAGADNMTLHLASPRVGGKTLDLTSIEAVLNPSGRGHVLLCAHWDSRPHADRDPDPAKRRQPLLGANDGASGVAVLLEIARVLKAHPPKQKVTIVLYDGEDYGTDVKSMLLGSRAYAANYRKPPPDWAVLLDMVGDKDLWLLPEMHSERRAPQVVDRVWSAAMRVGSSAFTRGLGPAVMDDHIPLLDKGIPCIDIIDFDYPYWHTTADTPDKCSAASLEQVGRAVLAAISE